MARPKASWRKMRRTTVDLPLLLADALRRAAFADTEREGLAWSGMFQRWIQKAVTHELERQLTEEGVPYWPLTRDNLPPVVINGKPPENPGQAAGRVLMEKKAQELREALPPELVEPLEREPAATPHYTYEPLPDEANSPEVIGTDRAPMPPVRDDAMRDDWKGDGLVGSDVI